MLKDAFFILKSIKLFDTDYYAVNRIYLGENIKNGLFLHYNNHLNKIKEWIGLLPENLKT